LETVVCCTEENIVVDVRRGAAAFVEVEDVGDFGGGATEGDLGGNDNVDGEEGGADVPAISVADEVVLREWLSNGR